MDLKALDKKGFVFINGYGRPFWCAMYEGEPWFIYWHEGNKAWVTLRRANQTEIWQAQKRAIPQEDAEVYHKQNDQFLNS